MSVRNIIRILVLCGATFISALSVSVAYSEDYHFLYKWGDRRPDLSTQLNIARGVATDNEGNVYVSDTYNQRIIKYNSSGAILWTASVCDDTPLSYPMEMATSADGIYVYVPDTSNNRICVYYKNGIFAEVITGNLNRPLGVATDASGNVYVTDRRNHVVKKFNNLHNLVATWSGFRLPWGITYHNGYIYVTDLDQKGNMVKKLTADGVPVSSWGPVGAGDGQFFMAEGVAVYNDLLYVADGEHSRIQVFDLNGNFVRIISERGTGNGQLQFASALAVDNNNGWLYAADDDNSRIVRFDLTTSPPSPSTQWGCDSSGDTGLRYPTKIGLDRDNKVMYVADSGNQRVIKMNLSMRVLDVWGSYGDGNGQFRYPIAAAVDKSGNVYVLDNANRNVQKFLPDGTFQAKWQINFDPLLYKYGLLGIAVDSVGNIYVVDAGTDKLYKLDPGGNKLAGWDIAYYSTGIGLDEKNGFIYISTFDVDGKNEDSVVQYHMTGEPTGKIFGQGILYHPFDVTVGENGNIYIADTFNHKVAKFDPATGDLLASWGSTGGIYDPGTDNSKFSMPYGIALDKSGNVYVADTQNHRIQKFTPDLYSLENTAPMACSGNNLRVQVGLIDWGTSSYAITSTVTLPQGFSLTGSPSLSSSFGPAQRLFDPGWNARAPLSLGDYTVGVSTAALRDLDNIMPVSVTSTPAFSDVPCNYWAFGWIEKFFDSGITSGCTVSPASYCPERTVTRDQMAVFIVKSLFGDEPVCNGDVLCKNTAPYFSDVPSDYWAFKYVQKMKETGITEGCAVGSPLYCPGNAVSRDQMAVFIIKARQAEPYFNKSTTFNDVPKTYWAYGYIEALSRLGITSGCGSGNYCPDSPVTRAQMAVFLSKAFIQ